MLIDTFEIYNVGWANCGRYWSWDRLPAQADCYDLWYIVSGEGVVCYREHSFKIKRGDFVLYPPSRLFSATQDLSNRLIVSYTHFNWTQDNPAIAWFKQQAERYYHGAVEDEAFFANLLRRSWLKQERGHEEQRAMWFAIALQEIYDQFSAVGLGPAGKFARPLDKLCDQIRAKPELPWQTEDMAAELEVSSSYFNKIFKSHTGRSPRQYLIDVRLDQVKSLLIFSNLSIGEIAEKLGYPDIFALSKQFAKHCGVPPSVWQAGRSAR